MTKENDRKLERKMVSAHRAFISSVSGIFMNIHEPALCTQPAVHRRRLFISLNCETVSETKANRLKSLSVALPRCVCVWLALPHR